MYLMTRSLYFGMLYIFLFLSLSIFSVQKLFEVVQSEVLQFEFVSFGSIEFHRTNWEWS